MRAEDAAFEMGQLDHDFYLFRDVASGEDSVLARDGTGYRLQHLGPTVASSSSELDVAVDPRPAPTFTVEQAIELLDGSGERFVFFASAQTGRGNVLYRRYDGHYGLITLE